VWFEFACKRRDPYFSRCDSGHVFRIQRVAEFGPRFARTVLLSTLCGVTEDESISGWALIFETKLSFHYPVEGIFTVLRL
jgi:hypothetical protein